MSAPSIQVGSACQRTLPDSPPALPRRLGFDLASCGLDLSAGVYGARPRRCAPRRQSLLQRAVTGVSASADAATRPQPGGRRHELLPGHSASASRARSLGAERGSSSRLAVSARPAIIRSRAPSRRSRREASAPLDEISAQDRNSRSPPRDRYALHCVISAQNEAVEKGWSPGYARSYGHENTNPVLCSWSSAVLLVIVDH